MYEGVGGGGVEGEVDEWVKWVGDWVQEYIGGSVGRCCMHM